MFLARKEILYYKMRYGLVVAMVALIGYLMFFLTGLAIGLAQTNRAAIDRWQAEAVVVSEYANNNLLLSSIETSQLPKVTDKDQMAQLGQLAVVVNPSGSETKINSHVFGLDWDSFIAPELVEGRWPKTATEVVMDQGLTVEGLAMGDKIQLNGSKTHYTIVGMTQGHRYFTAPLIFTDLKTASTLKYGRPDSGRVSALVYKSERPKLDKAGLVVLTSEDLIRHIPGYEPQLKTFSFMIGSMVVITFLILGIFMYILTIQKIQIYGVMRAQGIASRTLVSALFIQIFILAFSGMLLALVLIRGTQAILPEKLPFYSSWQINVGLTAAVVGMSLLGGLMSLSKILKIDPLQAIGGDA